ncbi:MAG: glycosyltransferase [Gammaproteobacteria bacterium]|nr:glycosyltransferase [Gammaproteobacteria bacterium]
MNKQPFFSILIPTKNRSHLVSTAIESVLNQSFDDFEIIIADNDDNSSATKNVVSNFNDIRIKYIRTGGLSMVENWEAARNNSSGKFITVLEDKQAYYKHSLESIHNLILAKNCKVVTWKCSNTTITKALYNFRIIHPEKFSKIESSIIINTYIQAKSYIGSVRIWNFIPRSINSCISSDLIQNILKDSSENTFYSYYSPDITSGFKVLFNTKYIYNTTKRLVYLTSKLGNGRLMHSNKNASQKYFSGNNIVSNEIALRNVPIKNPTIIDNTIYSDFLHVKKLFRPDDTSIIMKPSIYAYMLYNSISMRFKYRGIYKEKMSSVTNYVDNDLDKINKKEFYQKTRIKRLLGKRLVRK